MSGQTCVKLLNERMNATCYRVTIRKKNSAYRILPARFHHTAKAHALILIHTLSTLSVKLRFNGLLIRVWWHCESAGTSLL